jgi:hypothetical protein
MKRVWQLGGKLFCTISQISQGTKNDIWTLLSDSRLQKIVGGVFVGGLISGSVYYLERQVHQNCEDIKKLDAKIDRLDAKMDRQFSTIMAFVALGRLPGFPRRQTYNLLMMV